MIFAIGCLVGYAVYRQSLPPAHTSQPAAGNLAEAIGAALAVMLILSLLFGVGGEAEQKEETPRALVSHASTEASAASL